MDADDGNNDQDVGTESLCQHDIPYGYAEIFDLDSDLTGLLRAVFEDDVGIVQDLVSKFRCINGITDSNGNTPLHVAAVKESPEILKVLLSSEAICVNVLNSFGDSPLILAAKLGYTQVVCQLIAANANVNLLHQRKEYSTFSNFTALHASVGEPETTHILIKNGANVDAVDPLHGITPLHLAVERNCLETVCMLLFYNADANVFCRGQTPFMSALEYHNFEIQEILIDYVNDFNAVSLRNGYSTLSSALNCKSPYVEEIINRGADINYIHSKYNSLMMCLEHQNTQHFQLIWPKFKYQDLFDDINYATRFSYLRKDIFREYLEVILSSGNVQPIVDSFFVSNNLTHFMLKCYKFEVSLDDLTKLILLMLSYGYTPRDLDVDFIYKKFGFCDLFYYLMFMDITYSPDLMQMSKIIYDVSLNLNDIMDELIVFIDNQNPLFIIPNDFLHDVVKFIAFPKLIDRVKSGDYFNLLLNDSPDIPSLVELARNQFRKAFVHQFCCKRSGRYFYYLNRLNIPRVIKDILSFKKQLYNTKIELAEIR